VLRRLLPLVFFLVFWVPAARAWTWPVHGPVLQTFVFDHAHPYAAGQHRGIDIGAEAGAPVLAPSSGTVTFAGFVPGSGESVTIEGADGLAATLTHLGTIVVVKAATVSEGDVVGSVGPTGTAEVDGPYVHLGIRAIADENGYVDPLTLLPPVPTAGPQAPQPQGIPQQAAPAQEPSSASTSPTLSPSPDEAAAPESSSAPSAQAVTTAQPAASALSAPHVAEVAPLVSATRIAPSVDASSGVETAAVPASTPTRGVRDAVSGSTSASASPSVRRDRTPHRLEATAAVETGPRSAAPAATADPPSAPRSRPHVVERPSQVAPPAPRVRGAAGATDPRTPAFPRVLPDAPASSAARGAAADHVGGGVPWFLLGWVSGLCVVAGAAAALPCARRLRQPRPDDGGGVVVPFARVTVGEGVAGDRRAA